MDAACTLVASIQFSAIRKQLNQHNHETTNEGCQDTRSSCRSYYYSSCNDCNLCLLMSRIVWIRRTGLRAGPYPSANRRHKSIVAHDHSPWTPSYPIEREPCYD